MKNEEIDKGTFVLTFFINYLTKWLHHKLPFVHQWMRNTQVWLVNLHVVVGQYVDVDDAVMISSVNRFQLSSYLPLNALRCLKHLAWREHCRATHRGIDEKVIRLKAPRLGNEKS